MSRRLKELLLAHAEPVGTLGGRPLRRESLLAGPVQRQVERIGLVLGRIHEDGDTLATVVESARAAQIVGVSAGADELGAGLVHALAMT